MVTESNSVAEESRETSDAGLSTGMAAGELVFATDGFPPTGEAESGESESTNQACSVWAGAVTGAGMTGAGSTGGGGGFKTGADTTRTERPAAADTYTPDSPLR